MLYIQSLVLYGESYRFTLGATLLIFCLHCIIYDGRYEKCRSCLSRLMLNLQRSCHYSQCSGIKCIWAACQSFIILFSLFSGFSQNSYDILCLLYYIHNQHIQAVWILLHNGLSIFIHVIAIDEPLCLASSLSWRSHKNFLNPSTLLTTRFCMTLKIHLKLMVHMWCSMSVERLKLCYNQRAGAVTPSLYLIWRLKKMSCCCS